MSIIAINLKDLYDVYGGDPSNLSPVKGNTPFEYYTNDPEFTSDAFSVARFIAQRLGAVGTTYNTTTGQCNASPAVINITDLTVYAAFEEAVTTYGNLVYQYKIRDNYINIEGSDTLPFFNNTITYVNSTDVGLPVTWSSARAALFSEIGSEAAYSESIIREDIYVISSSLADYIAPDLNFLKSLNLADNYHSSASNATYNLSQFIYNQFNKLGGATTMTPFYNSNSGSFNFNTFTGDNAVFGVTGSNSVAIEFKVTSSATQTDTAAVFYVVTGSTAGITAYNIANKIASTSLGTFGTTITAVTGSSSSVVAFTSSLSAYNINNFKVNTSTIFTNVTSGSTPLILSGSSHVYLFTTNNQIEGGSTFFLSASIQQAIPTVYIQSNLKPSLNNKLLSNNLTTITSRIAADYGAEANVGGFYNVRTGSLQMVSGVQDYNFNSWAAASASLDDGDSIEVRRIFYQDSPAMARYYDPYAGTGTGMQSLLDSFGFGQMSPGINFLLMPIYADVQRVQAIELNDQIRKSAYSFDLVNNQLKIFPIPIADKLLFFEYVTMSQKSQIVRDVRKNVVTDIMNVPYRNPVYSNINTVGRTWVFKYTLAVCREIEAHIRIQFSNMNIQGVGPLQGSELITDARKEKEELTLELKEMLNETSRRGQLERKQLEATYTRDTLINIPLPIYIM